MDLQVVCDGKTFIPDLTGELKLGSYVWVLSTDLAEPIVGRVSDLWDHSFRITKEDGSKYSTRSNQYFILLESKVSVDDVIISELGEAYDDDRIDADRDTLFTSGTPGSPRAPRPAEQLPTEPTPQERQLEQWTTTRIVFSHSLKKGVPYAIKRRHSQEPLYGLYSGLLDPVTALFRYLNGEHKVTIQQLESGIAEIHEIVEDVENKEEF